MQIKAILFSILVISMLIPTTMNVAQGQESLDSQQSNFDYFVMEQYSMEHWIVWSCTMMTVCVDSYTTTDSVYDFDVGVTTFESTAEFVLPSAYEEGTLTVAQKIVSHNAVGYPKEILTHVYQYRDNSLIREYSVLLPIIYEFEDGSGAFVSGILDPFKNIQAGDVIKSVIVIQPPQIYEEEEPCEWEANCPT